MESSESKKRPLYLCLREWDGLKMSEKFLAEKVIHFHPRPLRTKPKDLCKEMSCTHRCICEAARELQDNSIIRIDAKPGRANVYWLTETFVNTAEMLAKQGNSDD